MNTLNVDLRVITKCRRSILSILHIGCIVLTYLNLSLQLSEGIKAALPAITKPILKEMTSISHVNGKNFNEIVKQFS